MVTDTHNEFRIQLKHDPEFQELIAKNEMPDGQIKIQAGDEYLVGDETHYVESIMIGLTLVDLLNAVEDAISGTSGDAELLDSGTHIVIEPEGEDRVAVGKCFTPTAIENSNERIFDPIPVPEKAVVSEIIRVAEGWRDDALDINPDIATVDWFDNLQQAIASVKSEYSSRSDM